MITEAEFSSSYRELVPVIARFFARRVASEFVEDLCSDTFEIAWKKRNQAPKGAELPWLYRIAGFVLSNHRRKEGNRLTNLFSTPLANSAPSAEELALTDLALAEAWRKLSDRDQTILALVAFDGLSPSELAIALEISVNAASIRLSRARARLSELLAASAS